MTGGMAFVYDEARTFQSRVNIETLQFNRIAHPHWDSVLRSLIEEHAYETNSDMAAKLLNHWDSAVQHFWQVVPTEIIPVLEMPLNLSEDLPKRA